MDVAPPTGGALKHVVLVHGIFDTSTAFRKLSRFLEEHGFHVHAPHLKPNSGRTGLEDLARKLEVYIEERLGEAQDCDIVGFSMGGLISRYYIQRLSGAARVRRLVTISTPHHGSRQMRPASAFLKDLNSDLHLLERASVVSMWTPLDLMIVPARSSHISIGTEFTIPVILHPLMLVDRRSHAALLEFLTRA
jgi:triacylglycerol lipase